MAEGTRAVAGLCPEGLGLREEEADDEGGRDVVVEGRVEEEVVEGFGERGGRRTEGGAVGVVVVVGEMGGGGPASRFEVVGGLEVVVAGVGGAGVASDVLLESSKNNLKSAFFSCKRG